MSRSLRAAAAAFLLTLTFAAFGIGLLLADINTRALAFGDAPAYTESPRLPDREQLETLPLPAPARIFIWLWEGERWLTEQITA